MSELRLIVDHQKLDYEGLFNLNALLRFIREWAWERLFYCDIFLAEEQDNPDGKFIEWIAEIHDKYSDYFQTRMKVRLLGYNIEKLYALKQDKRVRLDRGRLMLIFDGYVQSDMYNRWEELPFFEIVRFIFDKFLFRSITQKVEDVSTKHVQTLYHDIETFLGTYRFYRPISHIPHFTH